MDNLATNTTTPSNPPYLWMREPKQRGTFGIISFCFSTLVICIWSTLHFNIPIRRYTATRRFFLQVSWMILALLAPEVLLYLAINERITATLLLKQVLKFHPHLAKPGMLAHIYNWIRGRAKSKDKRYKLVQRRSQPHFGLVHAFYAIMGGFAFYGSFDDNIYNSKESLFEILTDPNQPVEVPKFETLIYIMKHFPHIITDITEDHILDRAASSDLSKALLIVQVAWFCTNCASRILEGLPLSLLEVSTAAHAFCTLLTYFVWWSKPINVAAPTILREKEAQEVYALLKCSSKEYDEALEMAKKRAEGGSSTPTEPHRREKIVLAANALQHLLPTPERPPGSLGFHHRDHMLLPGAFVNELPSPVISVSTSTAISPVLFGLVHFLAWNDHFPTPLERLLWRVTSFVVTCSGLVGVSVAVFMAWLDDKRIIPYSTGKVLEILCLTIPPFLHVLASGFLIVESFRQLFFLDPAAYRLPSWTTYWPRLS